MTESKHVPKMVEVCLRSTTGFSETMQLDLNDGADLKLYKDIVYTTPGAVFMSLTVTALDSCMNPVQPNPIKEDFEDLNEVLKREDSTKFLPGT